MKFSLVMTRLRSMTEEKTSYYRAYKCLQLKRSLKDGARG
jgi:hypothetical protein